MKKLWLNANVIILRVVVITTMLIRNIVQGRYIKADHPCESYEIATEARRRYGRETRYGNRVLRENVQKPTRRRKDDPFG